MTEQFANFAQGVLAAPITAGQTTISITPTDYTGRPAASNFPSLGDFRIVVQSFDVTTQIPTSAPEIMLVTAVAGNTFTVQRGAENSGAKAFASGAQVIQVATAAVMAAFATGGGGGSGGRKVITSPVTMNDSDSIVNIILTTPAAVAITGASGRTQYKPYTIKDAAGNAATYNITYTPASGTIDGMTSILIQQNYDSLIIYSDGTNEFTM